MSPDALQHLFNKHAVAAGSCHQLRQPTGKKQRAHHDAAGYRLWQENSPVTLAILRLFTDTLQRRATASSTAQIVHGRLGHQTSAAPPGDVRKESTSITRPAFQWGRQTQRKSKQQTLRAHSRPTPRSPWRTAFRARAARSRIYLICLRVKTPKRRKAFVAADVPKAWRWTWSTLSTSWLMVGHILTSNTKNSNRVLTSESLYFNKKA